VPNLIQRELFRNQIWHGCNFLSKALFLGVLTPYLLLKWGPDRYGMYALASSLVVVLAAMDGGIRDATRMALCHADANHDVQGFHFALQKGVMSFLLIVAVVFILSIGTAVLGGFSSMFKLPREGDLLICITVLLTGLSMSLVLMLEPLAARNKLSTLKKVNTFGSVAALPAVAACVTLGGGPLSAVITYFICQVLPYLWIWRRSGLAKELVFGVMKWEDYLSTYYSSGWLYLNSLVWLIRSHAMPFLISAMAGPAQAGVFYILLRMSEVISTLGAASCETLLASLRGTKSVEEKLSNFHHTYAYCLVFCGFSTIMLACLGQPMVALFFSKQLQIRELDTIAVAFFGITSAFSLLLFWSGYGVNIIRPMALSSLLVGSLSFLGCYLFQSRYGYAVVFGFGAMANIVMIPCASLITRALGSSTKRVWWEPAKRVIPILAIAGGILIVAYFSHNIPVQFLTLTVVSALALYEWKRLHY